MTNLVRRGEDDGVARNRLVVPEVEDVADADLLRQNRFRLPVPNDPDLALVHFSEVEKVRPVCFCGVQIKSGLFTV